MLDDLRPNSWLAATPATRDAVARNIIARLPEGWRLGASPAPGVPGFVWRDDATFALVPGATRLGFDVAGWRATPAEIESFAETVDDYFAEPMTIEAYVASVTGRPRTVAQGPFLCEVTTRAADAVVTDGVADGGLCHADLAARVASDGFALPSAGEWEAACAGGAATLFHWGDHAPMEGYPLASEGWEREPNAYGLDIACDTYRPDILDVPGIARGGDGGGMVCGAAGHFVAWLTLACAWCDPDLSAYAQIFGEHHCVRRILRLGEYR